MNKIISVYFYILLIGLITAGTVYAQRSQASEQSQAGKDKARVWGVSGEVSGITERSISVTYSKDLEKGTEKEILVPLDGSTKVERIAGLDALRIGDIVEVRYEEFEERGEDGPRKKRVARVVSFVKAYTPPPSSSVIGVEDEEGNEEDEGASSGKNFEEVYE